MQYIAKLSRFYRRNRQNRRNEQWYGTLAPSFHSWILTCYTLHNFPNCLETHYNSPITKYRTRKKNLPLDFFIYHERKWHDLSRYCVATAVLAPCLGLRFVWHIQQKHYKKENFILITWLINNNSSKFTQALRIIVTLDTVLHHFYINCVSFELLLVKNHKRR